MKKKFIFRLLNLKLLGSYALKKFLNLYRIIVGISVLSSLIYMASVWFIYGAFPEYPRFLHLNTLLFLSFSSLEFIGDLLATNLHKEILNLPAPDRKSLLPRLDTLSSEDLAKAREKLAIFFSEQSTGDSFSEQNLENQESQIPVNTESHITEDLLDALPPSLATQPAPERIGGTGQAESPTRLVDQDQTLMSSPSDLSSPLTSLEAPWGISDSKHTLMGTDVPGDSALAGAGREGGGLKEQGIEERNISEALKGSEESHMAFGGGPESDLDKSEEQSQNQQNLSELENSGSAMATELAEEAMARIAEGVSMNDGDLSAFELVFDLMNDGWISGDCIQVFYTAYESSEAVKDAMDTDDRFKWVGQNLKVFNRKD